MYAIGWFARRRNRAVWRDPVRRFLTLQSFAETEEDGGKDLQAAARRISDPDLRQHIERHAKDEVRHASLFRHRAAAVHDSAGSGLSGSGASDRAYDLSRGRRGELDAHGFANAGLADELGEVAYVCMLHVAEQRAAELFTMHHALTAHDPATQAVFEEILKDEKYHVAYTGKFLDAWRAEGREREVREGLKAARGSRFVGSWKRLGVRSAAGFSRMLMRVFYWTLLVPFGLVARRSSARAGWQPPAKPVGAPHDSQY
jgi:hypothetical protein